MVWCITSMLNSITSMNSIKSEYVKCGPSSDIILREFLFLVHKWPHPGLKWITRWPHPGLKWSNRW